MRRALIELRDKRLLEAFLKGKNSDDLVFRSPDGAIVDPDNLYHRLFLPALLKAGIRKIRLHDLRHTFGSQLIQSGASIVYVKEQMGHSSIQVTVDIYGHLIPGANVSFVDKLDEQSTREAETTVHQSAPETHQPKNAEEREIAELADLIGGGGRTRTYDLRIMSRLPGDDSQEFQQDSSVDSGKLLQNPQPPRNHQQAIPPANQAKDEGHAPTTDDCPPLLPPSSPIPRKE